MCRFIETIRIDQSGLRNIFYHNLRFNRTRKDFFGINKNTYLQHHIRNIPEIDENRIIRCTVYYSKQIEKITCVPYQPKKINSLKLIECNSIDYSYKYANREIFSELLSMKKDCDEIIIVKNGYITDTSYTNLVFFDGINYITPSTPLLKGTKRASLLEKGAIREYPVQPSDLKNFLHISLINSMLDIADYQIDIQNIEI